MSDIAKLESEIQGAISAAGDEAALEAVRVASLGKKGSVSELLGTLGKMTPDERKAQGPLINGLKDRVTAAITARKSELADTALDARLNTETVDVTLPVRDAAAETGRVHPISQVVDELTAIFADMGFAVAEGPDIETDDYNFTKLNFPEGHPAREMHDTFYFNPKPDGSRMLLRTHTSPVQVRTMQHYVKTGRKPPIRIICPGRVYRKDLDRTHSPMFHQVEGLYVAENVTLADLKHDLMTFLSRFFEREMEVMFRPSYFPFVEPGADVHIRWGERWLEVLGCGMVHPNEFKAVGLDPEKYTGYAFGMGVERMAMLRYGVDDLRQFFANDLRFLEQFK